MFLTQALAIVWLVEPGDYSLMAALYKTLNLFLIPSVGLQTLFAREASSHRNQDAQLRESGAFARGAIERLAVFWLILGLVLVATIHPISQYFKADSPLPIGLTWLGVAPLLMAPVALGWLQGMERFPSLGAAMLSNGVVRFLGLALLVGVFHFKVSGAVVAAGIGFGAALAIAISAAKEIRNAPRSPFPWRKCVRQFLPPAILLGIPQVFLGIDLIVVKGGDFDDVSVDLYSKAGLFGAGLVLFTTPLAQVMFPRSVRAQSGDHRMVLRDALLSVLLLACLTAGVLTGVCLFIGSMVETLQSTPDAYPWAPTKLLIDNRDAILFLCDFIPRFLWAFAPICLANTLLSHLAARQRFGAIAPLLAITLGYAVCLILLRPSMEWTLNTLCAFGIGLTAVASYFALSEPQSPSTQ